LRKYLIDAVKANVKASAKAKGKVRKESNNRGDLSADQIRPTRTVAASDIGAIADRLREEFDADLAARTQSIQKLEADREKLEKAAAASGAGRQAWTNSGARVNLDGMLAEQKMALSQLWRARADLIEGLEEVQRRAAGSAVHPPIPDDHAALRSVADGTYQSSSPDPAKTMTSGQIRSLEKRLEKAASPDELQRVGDQLTLAKLRAAAEAQFGGQPPLAASGRGGR
jgi:FAD/FMN-containing dehydrogenase